MEFSTGIESSAQCALVVALLGLLGGLTWLLLRPHDPLFHGKPESAWIKGIAYGMSLSEDQNQEQIKQWRDFGPDGLRVLARGLDNANQGRT